LANKTDHDSKKSDFRRLDTSEFQKGKFPVEIIDDYRVSINEDAYTMMKNHAATTVKVELCGILVGRVCKDEKGIFLMIDAVIEGRDASSQGAQVTFTHQTWNHINDVMDKNHPNKKIVGWYHTHPGFGVFLSGMDLFIQENFFNQPYQIAIVLETHAHEEGCFVWVDGVSVPLKKYFVGTREIKLAGHKSENIAFGANENLKQQSESSTTAREYLESQNNKPLSLYNYLIAFLLLLLGYFMGQNLGLMNFKKLMFESIESELYSIQEFAANRAMAKEDLDSIKNKVIALKNETDTPEIIDKKNTLIKEIEDLANKNVDSRNIYRKKLLELSNYKNSLSTRVNEGAVQTKELEELVAELYIYRLHEYIQIYKRKNKDEIKPEDQKSLEDIVNKILNLSPSKKQLLFSLFPDLLNAMYPQPQQQNKPEPDKPL
jgi:proteasome lid subunit RPN8/RPN11